MLEENETENRKTTDKNLKSCFKKKSRNQSGAIVPGWGLACMRPCIQTPILQKENQRKQFLLMENNLFKFNNNKNVKTSTCIPAIT
jgi:hypothetical protein